MTNQSVVIIAPDADAADCNAALAAYFGDDPGSQNLTVQLSADGQLPATHWGCQIWRAPDSATALKNWPSGSLPTPASAWDNYGLNSISALAAGEAMIVSVMSATDQNLQTLPTTNFTATLSALGLQRID
jgi:hypothetical protein